MRRKGLTQLQAGHSSRQAFAPFNRDQQKAGLAGWWVRAGFAQRAQDEQRWAGSPSPFSARVSTPARSLSLDTNLELQSQRETGFDALPDLGGQQPRFSGD